MGGRGGGRSGDRGSGGGGVQKVGGVPEWSVQQPWLAEVTVGYCSGTSFFFFFLSLLFCAALVACRREYLYRLNVKSVALLPFKCFFGVFFFFGGAPLFIDGQFLPR